MKKLELSNGMICLVDNEDYFNLITKRWHYCKGYAITTINNSNVKKTIRMHRFLLDVHNKDLTVDHINHDKLDNRKSNLRTCTINQNHSNRRKRRSCLSQYKGVTLDRRNYRWISKIKKNGKSIFLGSYLLEIEAAEAYNNKAIEIFGQYALLNKI